MQLLERDADLEALDGALLDARDGRGRVVIVSGEAGIGKTALVRAFLERHSSEARVLRGACDDLTTATPLGPIHDMARSSPELAEALADDPPMARVFSMVIEELQRRPVPSIAVVEDIHWADEATLDVVLFLSKRIEDVPSVLVITVRTDEPTTANPVQQILGRLVGPAVTRIRLQPLSLAAVGKLAGAAPEAVAEVHRTTGGNPFFVTEVIASGDRQLPPSVGEAVLARLRPTPEQTRSVLEFMSIIPSRAETWLVASNDAAWEEHLGPAEEMGIVVFDGEALAFRHELARRALEDALPWVRKRQYHRRVLDELERRGADPARIVHHASAVGDRELLEKHLPTAARRARAVDSHREALELYRQALDLADHFPEEQQIDLWLEYSSELWYKEDHTSGIAAAETALEISRSLGDRLGEARAHLELSDQHWGAAHGAAAAQHAAQALAQLEDLPAGSHLALAYARMATLAMLDWRFAEAEEWGSVATTTAEKVGATEALSKALVSLGTARLLGGSDDGETLQRGIDVSLEAGHTYEAARGFVNWGSALVEMTQYDLALERLQTAIEFGRDYEIRTLEQYGSAFRAHALMETGRWDEALPIALGLVAEIDSSVTIVPARYVVGTIQARTGDPEAAVTLTSGWEEAATTQELQRTWPIAVALAELAWLEDRLQAEVERLRTLYELGLETEFPWLIGSLALWLQRAGGLDEIPNAVAEQYALELEGKYLDAAAAWSRIGRTYEKAVAWYLHGTEESLLQAADTFSKLGALPMIERTRSALRELGVTSFPRGPARASRRNPAELTGRQVEVIRLLAEGLTNAEIAGRLFVSKRTIDHHVSAILTKLEAANRRQAVEKAEGLGLVGDE